MTWTSDGRFVVFGAEVANIAHLWRVRSDGTAPPERVEVAGPGAHWPSGATSRLVFSRSIKDHDIYRVEIGREPTPLLESSSFDYNPQYSPDGLRVAFCSGRSGEALEIWLADARGSNLVQLTRGPGRTEGSPRWSPDGRRVAFDSQGEDGHWAVWTIGADGTGLTRVTRSSADDNLPSWSRDGRWIYFTSFSQRPERDLACASQRRCGGTGDSSWRVSCLRERRRPDTLLHQDARPGPVFGRPTAGGSERQVLDCVRHFGYAIAPTGLFYFGCPPSGDAATAGRPDTG